MLQLPITARNKIARISCYYKMFCTNAATFYVRTVQLLQYFTCSVQLLQWMYCWMSSLEIEFQVCSWEGRPTQQNRSDFTPPSSSVHLSVLQLSASRECSGRTSSLRLFFLVNLRHLVKLTQRGQTDGTSPWKCSAARELIMVSVSCEQRLHRSVFIFTGDWMAREVLRICRVTGRGVKQRGPPSSRRLPSGPRQRFPQWKQFCFSSQHRVGHPCFANFTAICLFKNTFFATNNVWRKSLRQPTKLTFLITWDSSCSIYPSESEKF